MTLFGNKKFNTLLFFVAATLVNVLLTIVLALAVFLPYAVLVGPHVPGAVNLLAVVVILVGAMAGSFPLYRLLVEGLRKKIDFEKVFDPIVRPKRRRP